MTDKDESTKVIEAVLGEHEQHRDSLIPVLQEVQTRLGYLSEEAIARIATHLDVSQNDIFGVATFYTQFRFTRPGDHVIKACEGTACHVRGGKRILSEITKQLGIKPRETTPDYKFSLESVACFGSCALSPIVVVDDEVHARMTPQKVKLLLTRVAG